MVSSGKSTFLNSLVGIDVLEVKDDVTTKFVCIIRHNPNLKEPIFYHLKLSHDLKTDDYIYNKDGEETIGSDKIKERISKINKDQLEKQPNYENLFYMLELKIININNNEFLKTYDFYDIPGLNENINEKEESIIKEEKPNNEIYKKKGESFDPKIMEKNMKYINKLFPYFKKKIDFGIILIDTENYYYPSNICIIKSIYYIISKPIVNYMFILNKIDKSDNPNETIKKCKAFYTNNIDSSIFRISDNFFQPLNSKQFKNKMLMKNNFEDYYLYFLNEYININKNKNNQSISFSDFIYGKITEKYSEEYKDEKIESLSENINDFQFSEIKKIYDKTKKASNINIDYGFDFEDDDSINILKAFYKVFSDKSLIPTYSENIKDILNFFNNFSFETIKPEEKIKEIVNNNFLEKLKTQETIINNFIKVFEELKKYMDKDESNEKNIIETLSKDLGELKIMVLNQRKIYIPLIGVSSSGKSTILNDIVGNKIFPESKEECTRRGIIIQHSFGETSKLYEVTIDSLTQKNDYYIFKEKTSMRPIVGRNKIISFLESINDVYSDDEGKQFFLLKTPIEFFNEYNISEDLKRRIFFIDLPGSNSINNAFNIKQGSLNTYEKLLRVCTSFLFVNKGSPLKTVENEQILQSAFYSIQRNSKLKNKNTFLQNCSFVMNMFSIIKDEEKNIENVKNGISEIIFGKKEYNQYVNANFFNAKQYSEFLRYKNYYNNVDNLFLELKKGYNNQFNFLSLNSSKKEKNFIKYCQKTLNKELENLSLKIEPNFNCGEEFNSLVENKITKVMKDLSQQIKANDSKTINKISNTLNFIQKNIKNISFYLNSNGKDFFDMLIFQIYNSDSYIEKEFYDYLIHSMEKFESFFRIPPEKRSTIAQKKFYDLSKKIAIDLINLFENNKLEKIFISTKNDIEKYLDEQMANAKQLLKTNKNSVSATSSVIFECLMKNNVKQLTSNLKEKLDSLSKKFEEIKKYANEKGKEINNENHIEYSSFLEDLDKIKFDIYIKNHFGIDNFSIVKDDEFFNDIIVVHGFMNSIKIFFKYLFKGKDEKLKDILLALKNKFDDAINNEKISFENNYENMQKEIINDFTNAFLTQSSDLSRINNEDFEKALQLFIETKMILLEEKMEDESIANQKEKGFNNEEANKSVEEEEEEEEEIILGENVTNFIKNVGNFFNEIL